MIYTIGALVALAAVTLYAGFKWKNFIKDPDWFDVQYGGVSKDSKLMDWDRVAGFIAISSLLIACWPIALPAVGAFLLGKKFSK